jgi:hypothetical protein
MLRFGRSCDAGPKLGQHTLGIAETPGFHYLAVHDSVYLNRFNHNAPSGGRDSHKHALVSGLDCTSDYRLVCFGQDIINGIAKVRKCRQVRVYVVSAFETVERG